MDWNKVLRAFIFDRMIEEGNFIITRNGYKNLTDEEYNNLEILVEEVHEDYQNLKGA